MSQPNLDADSRRRLYDVFDAEDRSLAAKHDRALEIGRAYLGVENGHIERIVDAGETHRVVASVGDEELVPLGMEIEQSKTFCRQTIEQYEPLAISDVFDAGWGDDPAHHEHGIACYVGTPIVVDGETYGTVCFVSEATREESFTSDERAFVELLARLLGREIESKRHEDKLRDRERRLDASEQKYESLLKAAPNAIFLVDAETGCVSEVNDAATTLTGYDRQTLLGLSYDDLHPDDEDDRYRRLFERFAGAAGTRARFDDGTPLELQRNDGTTVPIEISATSVTIDGDEYVQGIVRDITDRRERQEELRRKNRAIDTASIGITIADATAEDQPLIYANDAFSALTGYDRADALGKNCRFLQGPRTDPDTVDELRAALDTGTSITTELLNYRADGTPFWNELTLAPVEDEHGAVTHFIGFQRDVTDRVRRERLLSVLNRFLRHNLRNKTNVILGQARHLTETLSGGERESAASIEAAATELATLGEKAHDMENAARERPESHVRDVVPVVEAAVDGYREHFDDGAPGVDTPEARRAQAPQRLDRALTELLENALEHGGPDPTVEVRVETDEHGDVRIVVDDDGPGLPAHERTVLDRGAETPLEHGSGLGLALVNWIVTGVGGQVTAAVDDGTTITIHLPGAEA